MYLQQHQQQHQQDGTVEDTKLYKEDSFSCTFDWNNKSNINFKISKFELLTIFHCRRPFVTLPSWFKRTTVKRVQYR